MYIDFRSNSQTQQLIYTKETIVDTHYKIYEFKSLGTLKFAKLLVLGFTHIPTVLLNVGLYL